MTFIVRSVNALGERTDELRAGSGREEIGEGEYTKSPAHEH